MVRLLGDPEETLTTWGVKEDLKEEVTWELGP